MQAYIFISFLCLTIIEVSLVTYFFLTLPFSKKIMTCDRCEQPIDFTAFLVRSKCEQCGSRHKYDGYWIAILALTGNIFLVFTHETNEYIRLSLIFAFLLLVFMIDLRYRYIFHKTTIFGFIAALGFAFFQGRLLSAILGAASGFLMMLCFFYLGVLYSKYKNKKNPMGEQLEEALGFGDVTLAGVLGAFLGFDSVFYALFAGIFLAGGYSLLMIARMLFKKQYTDIFMAYGPCLIIASAPYLFGNHATSLLP